ncbi:MAG: hypothetical protein DCF22_10745 [Leptolyngbya sp.]|nr:MAG: hypothetical protein DCF22_10745 [Leptolyngbya sp.]
MESQSESKTPLLKQPLIKGLVGGLLSIFGIAFILLVTRGSQFCFFSIGSCVQATPHFPIAPIGIAATAAAVLVAVVEVPVMVAVGIAIVIGLMAGQFLG